MLKKGSLGLDRMLKIFASQHLLEKLSSEINEVLEVVKVGDKILLNAANTNYSFGGLHKVFQRAFDKLSIQERSIEQVLILGFGSGSVATILRDELELHCRITAVEKDPEVIRIGEKYFDTGRFEDVEIIEADAAEFMANESRTYDLIIVDVYVDFKVPSSCETMEFVNILYNCLNKGGMILFNKLIYNKEAAVSADLLEEKFKILDGNTRVIKIRENILNKIITFIKPASNTPVSNAPVHT